MLDHHTVSGKSSKAPGSPEAKVSSEETMSPRNKFSFSIPAMFSSHLEEASGRHVFGTNPARDIKEQQPEPSDSSSQSLEVQGASSRPPHTLSSHAYRKMQGLICCLFCKIYLGKLVFTLTHHLFFL